MTVSENGGSCRVEVGNSGPGMAPESAARAFEPFYTTREKGSGLGLSMVYGFAKQSGGHVTIYSEAGQGTTVKLYLPRAEKVALTEKASRNGEIRGGNGERILVVGDLDGQGICRAEA